ncbi:MAG: hypothetical protein U0325_05045 [Polyangiales bacterium]
MRPHDTSVDRPRHLGARAVLFVVLGGILLVASVFNNRLEGWGMLLRALAGHALVLVGTAHGARAAGRTDPNKTVARVALLLAALLTPCALLILLMSRESGESWALASLLLAAWFLATGVVALVTLARRR